MPDTPVTHDTQSLESWGFCFRCKEIIDDDDDKIEVVPKIQRNRMVRVIKIHDECMIRGDELA